MHHVHFYILSKIQQIAARAEILAHRPYQLGKSFFFFLGLNKKNEKSIYICISQSPKFMVPKESTVPMRLWQPKNN
jgi:hypothetical protein